jgi:hypothetical protein
MTHPARLTIAQEMVQKWGWGAQSRPIMLTPSVLDGVSILGLDCAPPGIHPLYQTSPETADQVYGHYLAELTVDSEEAADGHSW